MISIRILVVEDDEPLCRAVRSHLEREGYETAACGDGEQALELLMREGFALIVLDRMLPGLDGIALLRLIREQRIDTRVLMLTALGAVADRVEGLDAGADDYLAKPFDVTELLARVRSLCRRSPVLENDAPRAGDLLLDAPRRLLRGPKASCTVTRRELQLLELFLRNPGQVLPRQMLFSRVWGAQAPVEEGNLDSYIHFLRRHLAEVGSACRIRTAHGIGYRLEAKGEAPC